MHVSLYSCPDPAATCLMTHSVPCLSHFLIALVLCHMQPDDPQHAMPISLILVASVLCRTGSWPTACHAYITFFNCLAPDTTHSLMAHSLSCLSHFLIASVLCHTGRWPTACHRALQCEPPGAAGLRLHSGYQQGHRNLGCHGNRDCPGGDGACSLMLAHLL